jgi:hypothetical protein
MSNDIILTTTTPLPQLFSRDLVGDLDILGNPYYGELHSHSRKEIQNALVKSREYLTSDRYLAAYRRLKIAERPPTDADIAKLFGLVLTFPNATKSDLTYFQGRLAEFIDYHKSELTVGVIELTIRKLEETCKFVPTIAEIKEAMDQAREIIASLRHRADWADAVHNGAMARLEQPRYDQYSEWED